MTRLIGTGADPLNRYAAGVVYDVPDHDEDTVAEHLERGWGRLADEEPSPIQVAHALVRGDGSGGGLRLDEERAVAERIGERALAVVHSDDPDAEAGAEEPPPGGGRQSWRRWEPARKQRR
jgi:hypothetical protein